MAYKRDYLSHAHHCLQDTANWWIRYFSLSNIGYAHEYRLDVIQVKNKILSSIIPNTDMQSHIKQTDQAIKTLPDDLFMIYWGKYVENRKVSRTKHTELLNYISGSLRR